MVGLWILTVFIFSGSVLLGNLVERNKKLYVKCKSSVVCCNVSRSFGWKKDRENVRLKCFQLAATRAKTNVASHSSHFTRILTHNDGNSNRNISRGLCAWDCSEIQMIFRLLLLLHCNSCMFSKRKKTCVVAIDLILCCRMCTWGAKHSKIYLVSFTEVSKICSSCPSEKSVSECARLCMKKKQFTLFTGKLLIQTLKNVYMLIGRKKAVCISAEIYTVRVSSRV